MTSGMLINSNLYTFALYPGTFPSTTQGWLCTGQPLTYTIYCAGTNPFLQTFEMTILNTTIEFSHSPTHAPSLLPIPSSAPTRVSDKKGPGGGGGSDDGNVFGTDDEVEGVSLGAVGGPVGLFFLCLALLCVLCICCTRLRGDLKHWGCWPDDDAMLAMGLPRDKELCGKCVWLCGLGTRYGGSASKELDLAERGTLDEALRNMGMRDNYLIPREELVLEARPFASGGGGQVFRGTYNGTVSRGRRGWRR
jgi:hypothetical protein